MKTPKPTHALKQGTFSIVLAAAVILIALAVNLLVSLLPHSVIRTDLTDLKLSELSKESLDYLGTLSEDITIYHICITGNEDPTVTDMLSKYEEACDNISIETIDPAVRPTFVGKYTDIALEDNSLIIVGEKRARAVEYYNMFTFELFYSDTNGAPVSQGEMSYSDFQTFYQYYSEYFGTYYSYDTLFAGESVTTSAIDYVTTESLPKVYTVTGHGEVELSENLLSGLYSDNIECAELSIMASGIPEDADCIIIKHRHISGIHCGDAIVRENKQMIIAQGRHIVNITLTLCPVGNIHSVNDLTGALIYLPYFIAGTAGGCHIDIIAFDHAAGAGISGPGLHVKALIFQSFGVEAVENYAIVGINRIIHIIFFRIAEHIQTLTTG